MLVIGCEEQRDLAVCYDELGGSLYGGYYDNAMDDLVKIYQCELLPDEVIPSVNRSTSLPIFDYAMPEDDTQRDMTYCTHSEMHPCLRRSIILEEGEVEKGCVGPKDANRDDTTAIPGGSVIKNWLRKFSMNTGHRIMGGAGIIGNGSRNMVKRDHAVEIINENKNENWHMVS